jgi:hypothetical protein
MKSALQFQAPAAILRAEIEAYRTANRLSREAIAIAIVEAHEKMSADKATEIAFEFSGSDAYDRAKKSAQKIFRWLDEGNLPANMVPSILAALPMELRIHVLNQVLRPLGVEARGSEDVEGVGFDATSDLKAMMKEGAEAQIALVGVTADAPVEVLQKALREVEEAREAHDQAARDLKSAIAGKAQLRAI